MPDLTGKYFEKRTAFTQINCYSQFPEPPTLTKTLHQDFKVLLEIILALHNGMREHSGSEI